MRKHLDFVIALAGSIFIGFFIVTLILSEGRREAQAQGPIVGPGQPILCPGVGSPAVQPTFTGTAALAQLVAGVAGQSIFVCGWHITNTAATGTFLFAYGTGTNCGTGTVTVLPAQSVSNTAPATDHIDYAFAQIPAGNALCQNSTATVSGIIYVNRF